MSAALARVIDNYERRGSLPNRAAIRLAAVLLREQGLPDTFHNRRRLITSIEPTGFPSYAQLRAFLATEGGSPCAS